MEVCEEHEGSVETVNPQSQLFMFNLFKLLRYTAKIKFPKHHKVMLGKIPAFFLFIYFFYIYRGR